MKRFGFSLIEVLIFTSIMGLFFVAAAAVTTTSLRVQKANENKLLATRYAEELLQWTRGEKEVDWEVFLASKTSISPGTTYCFNSALTPPVAWVTGGCSGYGLDNIFKREMTLASQDPGTGEKRVNVKITVEWQEGPNTLIVPIQTVFNRFE